MNDQAGINCCRETLRSISKSDHSPTNLFALSRLKIRQSSVCMLLRNVHRLILKLPNCERLGRLCGLEGLFSDDNVDFRRI